MDPMVTGVARANHSKGNGIARKEMGSLARKTKEVRKNPHLDAQPMIVTGSIQLGVEKRRYQYTQA